MMKICRIMVFGNMLKRIGTLFLIILLLLLVACSGDTNTTDTSGGESSTPSVESTAPSNDGTEDEILGESEAPSEDETPSKDGSEQETTQPEDVDLPKVEF